MQLHSYLTFNGNCREAMLFYKNCLGGQLTLQTVGDSPLCDKMPQHMQALILHACLNCGDLLLYASDMAPSNGLVQGNAVALSLTCSSEQTIKDLYTKLSDGGQANHPLELSFWGALFGDLTDKFGHHWILNYNLKNN